MIHFFPKFSNNAADSPYGQAVAATGRPHRFFSSRVSLRYRSRLALALLGWPRLILLALRSAVRSLVLARPYPDAVLLDSHFEVLAFGALRALRLRRGPRIVLLGFIFTQRSRRWSNALRLGYFNLVFKFADTVICHSSLETRDYQRIFHRARARFVYVPYGLQIFGRDASPSAHDANRPRPRPRLLSAGRSGRDFATLFEAVDGLDVDLHVVCDSGTALAGLRAPANVTVLRHCYGGDYVDELNAATLVIVPLAVIDISAGQMVMLQAMAFGKPLIVTRTPTVEEYVDDGVDAVLVPRGDSDALRDAIERLRRRPEWARALGLRAFRSYEEKYSMAAFVRNLMDVV